MLALVVALGLGAAPVFPKLIDADSNGFESARQSSGVLVDAHCFELPVRVCVPKGSWVWFEWWVCGPRSNAGCDDSKVKPRLRQVDATAPIEALGRKWAAVKHVAETPGERRVHTLQMLLPEVRGLLAAPATIAGVEVLPGPVAFSWSERPVFERLDEGTLAKAGYCGGWSVPPGTRMEGDCRGLVHLWAGDGGVLERDGGVPARVTESFSNGEFTIWGLVEPRTFEDVELTGRFQMRTLPDGGVDWVQGTTTREVKKGRCVYRPGSLITLRPGGIVVVSEPGGTCAR